VRLSVVALLPEHDEAFGIGVRQAAQLDGVDDGEESG
jgi:hypothetical protein